MSIFEMRRNARVLLRGEPHRLVKRVDGDIWQLEHERTGRLAEHAQTDLLELLRTGGLTYASGEVPGMNSPAQPIEDRRAQHKRAASAWEAAPEANRQIARHRLAYVKAIGECARSTAQIAAAIAREAKRSRDANVPSASAVQRWAQAYVRGGKDIVGLLPNFRDRGNRTSRVPAALNGLLEESIDAVYLTRERPTLQDTLDDAIHRVDRENQLRRRGEQTIPLPTRRMVRSVLSRRDPLDVCIARYGREYAAHKYRQVLNGYRIEHGLQRVEVDHTPVNRMVIDERTFLPLGRPWLSAAVDAVHRTFQGYALSFEPPSYLSVMRCLKHAIMPKTYLASRFKELQHDWPCHGVPDSLGLDNGKDFESTALRDFADRYAIDLDYCPVRRPWIKGIVERALGSINRGVAHGLPGTTFEDPLERDDYDSASRACVTLEGMHEIIHTWIVDVYHQRVHRTLGVSPQQSWSLEMGRREIPLPTSAVELDQALAVPMRRVLSHQGIQIDHLFYNSPECLGLLTRAGGSVEVDIGRPADDVGHIFVLDPRAERYLRVPVIGRFTEYATGLTPWQHTQCQRYAAVHYGGRNDVVALADAKNRIRERSIKELAKLRSGARKAAARFLLAEEGAGPAKPLPAGLAPMAATTATAEPPAASAPATVPLVIPVGFSARRSA